jgi:hypothetical protein
MDMCDSLFGGVVPGTAKLPRAHQLATMSKTERIRAKLSVDVPIDSTLFLGFDLEVMKSASYELQISSLPNHPGQSKVNVFDRRTSEDIYFQILSGSPSEGRFYCNTSGTEETPQKKAASGEQNGVSRAMHFELLDMVEESGKIYRHFRMMPEESFLEWMGAKAAADRPSDAYYEYWDDAETMVPYRLLNPDGSLVLFRSSTGGTTDDQVEAKLASLGQAGWDSTMACSTDEMNIEDPMAPTLGMPVPHMLSPMHDLSVSDVSFYAKLSLDPQVEAETGNGWETMAKIAEGDSPTSFSTYAMRTRSPIAMPDVCSDACAEFVATFSEQLKADPLLEFCDAPGLGGLVSCIVDDASQSSQSCAKSNFMKNYQNDCLGADLAESDGGRLLSAGEDEHWGTDGELAEGSEEHLRRAKKVAMQKLKIGSTKESSMTKLQDGSFAIDISALDAEQRHKVAGALGIRRLSAGRVVFNASDHEPNQKVDAVLEAVTPDHVESRRLMLDMNCMAPNVGPGCIFKIGYPLCVVCVCVCVCVCVSE